MFEVNALATYDQDTVNMLVGTKFSKQASNFEIRLNPMVKSG